MSAFPPTNLHLIGPHTCNNWLDDLVWIIRFVRLIVTCVRKSFRWIANRWADEILIKLWQWNWQCSRKTVWWRWHCTFWSSLWTGPLSLRMWETNGFFVVDSYVCGVTMAFWLLTVQTETISWTILIVTDVGKQWLLILDSSNWNEQYREKNLSITKTDAVECVSFFFEVSCMRSCLETSLHKASFFFLIYFIFHNLHLSEPIAVSCLIILGPFQLCISKLCTFSIMKRWKE